MLKKAQFWFKRNQTLIVFNFVGTLWYLFILFKILYVTCKRDASISTFILSFFLAFALASTLSNGQIISIRHLNVQLQSNINSLNERMNEQQQQCHKQTQIENWSIAIFYRLTDERGNCALKFTWPIYKKFTILFFNSMIEFKIPEYLRHFKFFLLNFKTPLYILDDEASFLLRCSLLLIDYNQIIEPLRLRLSAT